jgi:hypothetical protein
MTFRAVAYNMPATACLGRGAYLAMSPARAAAGGGRKASCGTCSG